MFYDQLTGLVVLSVFLLMGFLLVLSSTIAMVFGIHSIDGIQSWQLFLLGLIMLVDSIVLVVRSSKEEEGL